MQWDNVHEEFKGYGWTLSCCTSRSHTIIRDQGRRKPRNLTLRAIVVGTEIRAGPPVILIQRKMEMVIEEIVHGLI